MAPPSLPKVVLDCSRTVDRVDTEEEGDVTFLINCGIPLVKCFHFVDTIKSCTRPQGLWKLKQLSSFSSGHKYVAQIWRTNNLVRMCVC